MDAPLAPLLSLPLGLPLSLPTPLEWVGLVFITLLLLLTLLPRKR